MRRGRPISFLERHHVRPHVPRAAGPGGGRGVEQRRPGGGNIVDEPDVQAPQRPGDTGERTADVLLALPLAEGRLRRTRAQPVDGRMQGEAGQRRGGGRERAGLVVAGAGPGRGNRGGRRERDRPRPVRRSARRARRRDRARRRISGGGSRPGAAPRARRPRRA